MLKKIFIGLRANCAGGARNCVWKAGGEEGGGARKTLQGGRISGKMFYR